MTPLMLGLMVFLTSAERFDPTPDGPDTQLLQQKLMLKETLPTQKPWQKYTFLVGATHKAGTHLLREVMCFAFDIMGARDSCMYPEFRGIGEGVTSTGVSDCNEMDAPIQYHQSVRSSVILRLREEGPLRGVMTIRDPLDMVASGYVYHHRGAEPDFPFMPKNITQLSPAEGVPLMALYWLPIITAMTTAFEVKGNDVLAVRYETITNSSDSFNASVGEMVEFLFRGYMSPKQKQQILDAASREDLHLHPTASVSDDPSVTNHTSPPDDITEAKEAWKFLGKDLQRTYHHLRTILGYV
ncbi:unnamed protein product [Durusdinium trenchii]|uniref:Sulfotransferase domain-containing protein n=1 Tax=Durusdinium trenchii TaxID=1381693 RepID=A0ABP0L134_9DINO